MDLSNCAFDNCSVADFQYNKRDEPRFFPFPKKSITLLKKEFDIEQDERLINVTAL